MKLAIVSGGFDPLHVGHIELMGKAREKADSLIVIVNNDKFLERKKGKAFMPLDERITIVHSTIWILFYQYWYFIHDRDIYRII